MSFTDQINIVFFESLFVSGWFQFHQYQVVGRGLPTETDQHPKIYRMKLWATNDVRAKSKFWWVFRNPTHEDQILSAEKHMYSIFYGYCRYFLRKLKKIKKSNGQVLAINEVCAAFASVHLLFYYIVLMPW